LAINRFWDKQLVKAPSLARAANSPYGIACAHVLTFVTVLCGWVFFRAKTLPEAIGVFCAMFSMRAANIDCEVAHAFFNSPVPAAVCVYLFILFSGAVIKQMEKKSSGSNIGSHAFPGLDLQSFAGPPALSLAVPLPAMANLSISFFIALVLLAFCRGEVQPFIYFQF
jgi:hypothetical protein